MESIYKSQETAKAVLEQIRAELSLKSQDQESLNKAIRKLGEINDWRFSKGELYSPMPYFNELGEFPQPREIKKKFSGPLEARNKGYESFGFINNELTLTIDSTSKGFEDARLTCSLVESNDNSTDVVRTHNYLTTKTPERKTELISISKFLLLDEINIYVSASLRGDFFYRIYQLDNNLVSRIYDFGKNFPSQVEYFLHRNPSGDLEKITTQGRAGNSDIIIWPRN